MKTLIIFLFLFLVTATSFGQNKGNSEGNATVYDMGNAYRGANSLAVQSGGNSSVYNNAYQFNNQRTMTQFLNDTTMMITVIGLLNTKAENYVAIYAVTQIGSTIDSATMLMNERTKKFMSQLKSLGIKESDIVIDQISQVPTFDYAVDKHLFSKTYTEIPTGFEIKKNIHVGFSDSQMLDDIMAAAAKAEIYDIVKVDYNVNNITDKYKQLRKACLAEIKDKVEDFAAMGLRFQPLNQTFQENSQSYYPLQRYSSYQAYNNASVQMTNTTINKGTTVNTAVKPTTYYYNRVPYDMFDVVINPNMVEPGVQFTYSVSIKYTLKGPERPVGLTAPLAKAEEPKKKKGGKIQLPNTFNFKFEVPGEDDN
jgi:uncharacterized protein YggE